MGKERPVRRRRRSKDSESKYTGPKLCDEQKQAVEAVRACYAENKKRAVILTGCAGSGKSTVIKYLLETYPKDYIVTATTGKAAVNVNGITVDRLFKFNRTTWTVTNQQQQADQMFSTPNSIIIDEASMIGEHMAELLYDAVRSYGKQLILVGDWAQARPVKENWPFNHKLFREAFVINLQENHRQEEGFFYDMLNRIRVGDNAPDISHYFQPRIVSTFECEDTMRLMATNDIVDAYNDRRLQQHLEVAKLIGHQIRANFVDMRNNRLRLKYPPTDDKIKNVIDNTNLADGVGLAINCRILITRNGDGYVNGDTGTLKAIRIERPFAHYDDDEIDTTEPYGLDESDMFEDDWDISTDNITHLEVELDRTGSSVNVVKETISTYSGLDKDGKLIEEFRVTGLPVRLGYALTIHKSQGMTVPRVWVDLDSIMRFPSEEARHGLAYVALSRVTDVSGLFIGSWQAQAISCSPIAREIITAFNQASVEEEEVCGQS